MEKPKGCVYPDCFACIFDDCIDDRPEEIALELETLGVELENLRATTQPPLRNNKLYKKLMGRKNYLERISRGLIDEERP